MCWEQHCSLARHRAEPRTGADANSLRSCVAAAAGAAHRGRSAKSRGGVVLLLARVPGQCREHSSVGDQITAIESFRVAISQAALNVERRRGMPFSISTLLIRNLGEV